MHPSYLIFISSNIKIEIYHIHIGNVLQNIHIKKYYFEKDVSKKVLEKLAMFSLNVTALNTTLKITTWNIFNNNIQRFQNLQF